MDNSELFRAARSSLLATRWLGTQRTRPSMAVICLVSLTSLCSIGCSSFGSGKLVHQLQNDNERLLGELRATKNNVEEQKKQNQSLQARLAEAEKLLAVQQQVGAPRLSSLTETGGFAPGSSSTANSAATANSSSPLPGTASPLGSANPTDQFRWQRRIE